MSGQVECPDCGEEYEGEGYDGEEARCSTCGCVWTIGEEEDGGL
jgi:uncharacterized protein (DUF983 family)